MWYLMNVSFCVFITVFEFLSFMFDRHRQKKMLSRFYPLFANIFVGKRKVKTQITTNSILFLTICIIKIAKNDEIKNSYFLNIDLTFDHLNQIHFALDLTGSTDYLHISNISLGT